MSFLSKAVVIATSVAIAASSLTIISSAPATAANSRTNEAVVNTSVVGTSPISTITQALTTADLVPANTAAALDKQVATVRTALQDAEAAALEASGEAVTASEAAAQEPLAATYFQGTSLAKLSLRSSQLRAQQAADRARQAEDLFGQAHAKLAAKSDELVRASAKLRGSSVTAENIRLAKLSAAQGEAELMTALQDSKANVAEPSNDPTLDPESPAVSQLATGTVGSTSVASSAVMIQAAAVSRTTRINRSITWAQATAKNNKYKYRYGATGPTYFDCSGYTGKAFAKGGKILKRTSGAQYKAAPKKVKLANLQKGDLVFWSSNGGRSFYHVAMYIGNGNIAHARNPQAGISVTKLNYAGMRNIFKYAGRY